jgi:hypothetical protein
VGRARGRDPAYDLATSALHTFNQEQRSINTTLEVHVLRHVRAWSTHWAGATAAPCG